MELNKQDEKLLQELLKKYKQGVISGLYQGTNITFTPTGCRDKVISSSGGSGGDSQTLSISSDILTISGGNSVTLPIGLFPNGYNFIDTDYVLQASDEGKLIIALAETPIHITVPTGSDVFTNKIIGIAMISSGDFEIEPSVAVNPLHQTNDGLGVGDLKCETVICQTFTGDGINSLSVLSTSVINDNGSYKTMLRYLYDKSGGGGTPAGSDTQIQYNNAGAFGADSGFTRDVAGGSTTILNTTDFGGGDTIDGGFTTTGGITTIEQFYSASAVPLYGARLQIDGTENAVNLTTANNTSGDTNGFYSKGSLTVVGNYFGGNGTSITIDDGNEQITIGNIKAYDDDAAAGTGGLIAGMVYMTTGSGAAPLDAAGILMIKQ